MSLVNKKSIQNFIVKAVGYVTAQTQRRELFTRPEFNLAEIRDASEADSYVKISLSKISYLIYNNGMSGGQFGFQSANAFVFFIVIVAISLFQMKFLGSKEEQL